MNNCEMPRRGGTTCPAPATAELVFDTPEGRKTRCFCEKHAELASRSDAYVGMAGENSV